MTPEHRETLHRKLMLAFAAGWDARCEQNEGGDYGPDEPFDTLQRQWVDCAIDALRAALVERTCGTCKHRKPDMLGLPLICGSHASIAVNSIVRDDDGCIKGWEARTC